MGVFSQGQGALKKNRPLDTKMGGFPVEQKFIDVEPASTTKVIGATALKSSAQTISGGITDPDVYRGLSVKGNQAGISGNVVITGWDWAGHTIQETIALSGTNTVNGNMPFKSVYQIQLPARTNTGDTVSVGVSDKLGTYRRIYEESSSNFIELERRASSDKYFSKESNSPTVNGTYGTVLPHGGVTSNDCFRLSYLSDIF